MKKTEAISNMEDPIDVVGVRRILGSANYLSKFLPNLANVVELHSQCHLYFFRSYCTNMDCCSPWFNSTSSSIKKLEASYNDVLRHLL